MFETIERMPGLTDRAERQLQDLILNRTLLPGDRLPPERALCEKLQVSKTVVREALKALSAQGLVEIRRGSGTYVRHYEGDLVGRPLALLLRTGGLDPEHIHELRQLLEVHIAGLAAERATAEHIVSMQETIDAIQDEQLTVKEYAEADVRFHKLLARAADNPLFTLLLDSLNSVMMELRKGGWKVLGREEAVRRTVHYHSQILDFVRRKDSSQARKAMHNHLEDSLQVLCQIQEKDKAQHAGAPADSTTAGPRSPFASLAL
jgi:GntR family transcriptional repressor for pyruvate dehydrogenase complex